jgi:diaminopimelate epimerase
MFLDFTKMNGAGNDFVLADGRTKPIRLEPAQVARLCDRHRGVGADGLILLIPCVSGKADWAWDFYNSDGSRAEMCGNGARCFARYIQRLTGAQGRVSFETVAGVISAEFLGERVRVNLTAPKDMRLNAPIRLNGADVHIHFVNTGVPHAALFVPDADQAMVQSLGREIRFHPHFAPKGANANFIQTLAPGSIRVRTYERGVEDETLACGTGVTASALIAAELNRWESPVRVRVQGGDELEVSFERNATGYSNARLTGPADFVFDGRIEV